MARPKKYNSVNFSHSADLRNDRRVKAIRNKFGVTGYAVYVMLLEILTGSEYFKSKYDSNEIELFSGEMEVDPEYFKSVTDYAVQVGLLATEDNFIFSPDLSNELLPLLEKREKDRLRKVTNKVKRKLKEYQDHTNNQQLAQSNTSGKEKNTYRNHSVKKTSKKKRKKISDKNSEFDFKKVFNLCQREYLNRNPHHAWNQEDNKFLFILITDIRKKIERKQAFSSDPLSCFKNLMNKIPIYLKGHFVSIRILCLNFGNWDRV